MNTKHTVTARREVPRTQTNVGVFTGKTVTENLVHGGQKGVYVKIESGFTAWGFGPTWEAAEIDAVENAVKLETSAPSWLKETPRPTSKEIRSWRRSHR